jgi:hypothetical protein
MNSLVTMNRTWVACWADALNLQPSIECTWVWSFLISINGLQFVAGFSEFVLGGMLGWCSRSATIYWMHMGWKVFFYLHQQSAVCRKEFSATSCTASDAIVGFTDAPSLLRLWFWCICNHDGTCTKTWAICWHFSGIKDLMLTTFFTIS